MIILLFFLSLAAFVSHRIGLMDSSFSVMAETKDIPRELIMSKGVDASFDKSDGIALQCQLENLDAYNFCGVGIALSDKSINQGVDLSVFNRVELSLKYNAPINDGKLKISFRNYNENYSTEKDMVSLKFNSIAYNPNSYDPSVVIPLAALKVDNWWIEQYKISFDDSQVELSNVTFLEILTNSMNISGHYVIEIENIVLYGELISESNLLRLILLVWLIVIIYLITLQRNKLKRLSMSDTLTGLYNRQGIQAWTNKKISPVIKQNQLYMFYLDLDDFKKVNDTYGHHVGDSLLVAFSKQIQNFLDLNLKTPYAFSRLSGDEFALVTVGLQNDKIINFAENLLKTLDAPLLLENHQTYIRASLGISELKEEIRSFEDLLGRADSAMYYAKKEGKNCYKLFDQSISQDLFFRKKTAEKIKNAIIQNDFHLNFMPIFETKSLKMASVEVLLRTNSEALKGIGPDVFIPIAEQFNLIKDIDLWVIEATFQQIAGEKDFLSENPLVFCINISAAELHNSLFVAQLKALLKLYKIRPDTIELEITETSLIETDAMSITTLEDIRNLGIKLSLDDFGTGYTAFSQLINYPVDTLKIDKSFIDNLAQGEDTQNAMIKAIISIAQSYQLKTIGEGVELKEQYDFLIDQGCDYIQGYLFAKPMLWGDLKQSILSPK
jgi:diguanylate cyclase (GGDEF)-like protein